MKIITACTLILYSTFSSFGQDLISNGSFENTSIINNINLHGDMNDSVESWHSMGTADIFSLSTKGEVYALNNLFGFQLPYSGKKYAGIFMGKKGTSGNELIWTYLDSPLIKDSTYCISFKYSLADYSELAVKEIGISFSEDEAYNIYQNNFGTLWEEVIKLKPIKQDTNKNQLINTKSWSEFKQTYKAKGNEHIIYLGCFPQKTNSDFTIQYTRDTIPKPDIWIDYSYYYVDDVSLTMTYEKNYPIVESDVQYNLVFDSLTFDINEYSLSDDFISHLENICAYLKQHDYSKIVIEGYTDDSGNEEYNKKLSSQRAEEVRKIMVKEGINFDKIYIKGYGNSKPIVSNDNVQLKHKNRRVIIKIY